MWCIFKLSKNNYYIVGMLLYCVCVIMNYKGKSTIYLGCYSADPYPWIWDMFTHGKNDLLTMGQKYNVKMCAHLNLQKSFREQLVRFFWVIWCTYYQICKNHGSQLPESMGMGQGYRESSIPLLVHHIYMLIPILSVINFSRGRFQHIDMVY